MIVRRFLTRLLIGGLAAFVIGAGEQPEPGETAPPKPDSDGFLSMFDGKTLDHWHGLEGFWSVKDGAISGQESKEHPAPQTDLIYDKSFGDFELRYKYKFATPDGNSGVQIRSKVVNPEQSQLGGYQADCDAARGYDGSIYDEQGVAGGRGTMSNRGEKTIWTSENKRENTPLPESSAELQKLIKQNDWNDAVVVAKGNHITYTINGHLMTDLTDESPKAISEGKIGLQLHAGFVMDVQYKDLKIKPLKKE